MSLFFNRLFWFILVLASGFVATLVAASQYGIKVDLNAWAKIAGLHDIAGVTEIINEVPGLLNLALIKSYGFYGSLGLFLLFLLIFTVSLRSRSDKRSESIHAGNADNSGETNASNRIVTDSFSETVDKRGTANDIVTETNSNAVLGTDGQIYDGTATFSGTDTYARNNIRPELNADADNDDEVEDDGSTSGSNFEAEPSDLDLSRLSDDELKSKTLNFAEEMRSFEADYQSSRDEAASELTENVDDDDLKDVLQNVKDTYEQRNKAYSSDFQSKYGPEAIAMRHEISKRLEISEPSENFSPALDQGMLVGANPVTDAADLIEDLVKKLA